jgi:hypothetical protein
MDKKKTMRKMSEIPSAIDIDLLEKIFFLIIGWLLGFLGTMAFDWWKRSREIKAMKNRIEEELTLIRSEIDSQLETTEGELIQGRSHRSSAFNALANDIIRKLDVKTSRQIEIAYAQINRLGVNSLRRQWEEALNCIDNTLKALKDC